MRFEKAKAYRLHALTPTMLSTVTVFREPWDGGKTGSKKLAGPLPINIRFEFDIRSDDHTKLGWIDVSYAYAEEFKVWYIKYTSSLGTHTPPVKEEDYAKEIRIAIGIFYPTPHHCIPLNSKPFLLPSEYDYATAAERWELGPRNS